MVFLSVQSLTEVVNIPLSSLPQILDIEFSLLILLILNSTILRIYLLDPFFSQPLLSIHLYLFILPELYFLSYLLLL